MTTEANGAGTGDEAIGSMDDALNGALDSLGGDDAGAAAVDDQLGDALAAGAGEGDAAAAAGEDDATGADGEGQDGSDAGRERDEHGRFKAKDAGDGQEAGAEAAGEGKEGEPGEGAENASGEESQPQMVEGRDISKAPTTWKKEATEGFDKLPENVRREIHRREEDMFRGIEQYKGAAAFGVDMAKLIQPHKDMLEQAQLAPSDLMNAVLQFEAVMRSGDSGKRSDMMANLAASYQFTPEESAALISTLAQSAGIDLGDAVPQPQQVDPTIQAMRQEIAELKGKLSEREKAELDESNRQQSAAREEVQREIAAFAADPKNEFYGQVKDDMLNMLKSGQASDLQSAYDKAVWINPVTREKLLARQREAERKSAAEKAAAARKANQVNVTPRATPSGKATGKGTMEDALGEALDQVLA